MSTGALILPNLHLNCCIMITHFIAVKTNLSGVCCRKTYGADGNGSAATLTLPPFSADITCKMTWLLLI